MKSLCVLFLLAVASVAQGQAEVKVFSEHKPNDEANRRFHFRNMPAAAKNDAASTAHFSLIDGTVDSNSGGLSKLNDGELPTEEDQPGENFFFAAGSNGGRLLIDLGRSMAIQRIATYSWHPGPRGPQVYTLYGAEGAEQGFMAEPKRPADPTQRGWKEIATVDTRPKSGEPGGQYAVAITNSSGELGTFRYLLLDVHRTEEGDGFGNTFFSEIDVAGVGGPELIAAVAPGGMEQGTREERVETVETNGYEFRIETSGAPDLTEWAHTKVAPMALQWYPKLVQMLASDHFDAPKHVTIIFDAEMRGVAATGGTRVRCAARWFRQNLQGEALGAVFHELVHVVQQYGRARRIEGATRPPGWLVEGIADYVRWYKFEPESHGAEITARNISRARYNGSYRITANFLDWASRNSTPDLVPRINAAIRQGKYSEALWKELTGRDLETLGEDWKKAVEENVQKSQESKPT